MTIVQRMADGADAVARRARDLLRVFPVGAPAMSANPDLPRMLDAWRPATGVPAVLVRWLVTEWCNYRCPYCPQTHDRRAAKGAGLTAHAFDNFPLTKWIESFEHHFDAKRLSLVITGGEPMIDRKNMLAFLNHMSAKPSVECIRIDTNAWWKPEQYADLDRSKIILMCTFHPSQIGEEKYIENIKSIVEAGFKIGMVNYVMDKVNVSRYHERSKKFADFGVMLHPNPLWGKNGDYSDDDIELMRAVLPALDFQYRSGSENPKGKPCYFPTLAFEMDYRGDIMPGCMEGQVASFFDSKLPVVGAKPVACPFDSCACLDKYSFLRGCERNVTTNPLAEYSKMLWSRTATVA